MPISKLDSFTKKVGDLADKPVMSSAELKAYFDAAPEELREKVNNIVDNLLSSVDGDSGADNIKVTPISGVTGETIQSILENLKGIDDANYDDLLSQIQGVTLGQIPNGTVTPEKLSFSAETTAGAQGKVDTHANRADNPHSVTTTQIGAVPTSEKGVANGVASLDSSGALPIAQNTSKWQKISDITLSSDAASVEFTGLSGYRFLRITLMANSSNTADVAMDVRLNNDSGVTYNSDYTHISGTTVLGSKANTTRFILNNTLPSNDEAPSVGEFIISNIQARRKSISGYSNATASSGKLLYNGEWTNSTDLISSVQLSAASAMIKSGSRFLIEGVA